MEVALAQEEVLWGSSSQEVAAEGLEGLPFCCCCCQGARVAVAVHPCPSLLRHAVWAFAAKQSASCQGQAAAAQKHGACMNGRAAMQSWLELCVAHQEVAEGVGEPWTWLAAWVRVVALAQEP